MAEEAEFGWLSPLLRMTLAIRMEADPDPDPIPILTQTQTPILTQILTPILTLTLTQTRKTMTAHPSEPCSPTTPHTSTLTRPWPMWPPNETGRWCTSHPAARARPAPGGSANPLRGAESPPKAAPT